VTSYGYALIHAGLGDKEQALIWLRKAVEERSHWLVAPGGSAFRFVAQRSPLSADRHRRVSEELSSYRIVLHMTRREHTDAIGNLSLSRVQLAYALNPDLSAGFRVDCPQSGI
jgi:hypothetical protein